MTTTARKRRRQPAFSEGGRLSEVIGLFLLTLAILTALALLTYQSEAQGLFPRKNLLNGFGDQVSSLLIQLSFGRWPSFVFPLLLFIWSVAVLFHWKMLRLLLYSLILLLCTFWISFAIYLFEASNPVSEHAGLIGVSFGNWIRDFMGIAGSWIVFILVILIGFVSLLRFKPSELILKLFEWGKAGAFWITKRWSAKKTARPAAFPDREEEVKPLALFSEEFEDRQISVSNDTLENGDLLAETQLPVPDSIQAGDLEPSQRRPGVYHLPSLTLLNEPPPESPDAPEELRSKAKRLQEALSDFGVGARVVKINPGPVITRFDLEPDPGVKVSRISGLADDLALVLRARAIRIQAPIPGQGAVGVEIPNRRPSIVVLKSVAGHSSFQDHPSPLAIALGQTAAGEPYVTDLGRMPHLLVAGTTGSGKSVCLNAIIASLLFRNPPENLQFVIIDPKKLEMSIYARLARHHLLTSPDLDEEVITTPANAVRALGGIEIEMGRRYDLMADAGVRNIEEFNAMVLKGEAVSPSGEPLKKLSYLIVVVDELADLMMIAAREVEDPIARLAQMARAVGIHLIVATQRPSVDVITGVIKANFPARLAFQVASKVDSRTILDANGAETLLGNGDALFIPPGRGQPERIHSCYVSPPEIESLVSFIEGQPDDFHRQPLIIPQAEGIVAGSGALVDEVDELFEEAARMVIRQGQASVSILQRRFKIGYARAGRLIDQLERSGVIGPFDGSKAREVLVDETYLESLRGGPPPLV